MRESLKTSVNAATVWVVIVILCIFTIILGLETLDLFLEPPQTVTLEQTAATTKEIMPTGELYLLSSIQEDYVMSNDEEIQNILTSYGVNLKRNIVGVSNQNDCSQSALTKLTQTIEQNRIVGKFAENLELNQRYKICEEENKLRFEENSKIFIITLSEKCGYYIDFSDKELAPKMTVQNDQIEVMFEDDALKVQCMPQNIQFLSNVEEFWANHADDRVMDAIKERLEKTIIDEFSRKYRAKASENAIKSLTSLFCAMKYQNISINGTTQSCQSRL